MKKLFLSIAAVLAISYSYGQNSAGLPSGNIGIGTTNPKALLDISTNSIYGDEKGAWKVRSATADQYMYASYLDAYSAGSIQVLQPGISTQNLLLNAQGGNVGIGITAPKATLDISTKSIYGDEKGALKISSQTANQFLYVSYLDAYNAGSIQVIRPVVGPQNLLLNAQGGSVAIGTTDPKGYMLAVNGSTVATSMTVQLNTAWPDYVFKKDYELPSLKELKTYVDQYHHLPEMPTESQVAKDGLNLGEINSKLVKKVEELTLYLIEQHKQIEILEKKDELNQSQEERIKTLEKQVEALLKR